MSQTFESIKKGLIEAIEFSKGNIKNAKVTHKDNVDVKKVRRNIGMTQKDFALSVGISILLELLACHLFSFPKTPKASEISEWHSRLSPSLPQNFRI